MRQALTIAPATPQDTPVVHALLNDAAAWLAARRIDQWPYPFPEYLVREFIGRNSTYLARYGNDPVGTLAVYWEDPTFWGAQPADAGYVHALAVDSRARGHGLGAQLLDWAARLAATRDRTWLRLDCGADNTPLRRYYERLGFQHVSDIVVAVARAGSATGPWGGSLYQREAKPLGRSGKR